VSPTPPELHYMQIVSYVSIILLLYVSCRRLAVWSGSGDIWHLMLVTLKTSVLRDVMPCWLVEIYKSFGGSCCLHLHSRTKGKQIPPKWWISTSLFACSCHSQTYLAEHLIAGLIEIYIVFTDSRNIGL